MVVLQSAHLHTPVAGVLLSALCRSGNGRDMCFLGGSQWCVCRAPTRPRPRPRAGRGRRGDPCGRPGQLVRVGSERTTSWRTVL
eukprot:336405-Prymnesium_polylepis.1